MHIYVVIRIRVRIRSSVARVSVLATRSLVFPSVTVTAAAPKLKSLPRSRPRETNAEANARVSDLTGMRNNARIIVREAADKKIRRKSIAFAIQPAGGPGRDPATRSREIHLPDTTRDVSLFSRKSPRNIKKFIRSRWGKEKQIRNTIYDCVSFVM